MNDRQFINKIMIGAWLAFAMAFVHAGTPLWTFTPLTATTISVAANDIASVSYQVTNQSRRSHTLAMNAIPGVTQVTSPGNCPNPFVLGYKQSCILNLSIHGSALNGNVSGGPVVCQGGNPNQCYQPGSTDILQITLIKRPAVNFTVGNSVFGLLGTLVLTNNGEVLTMKADGKYTFSSALPPGSPYQVTIQSKPANQTCTVINGSGIITNANITNITVYCSINARTVGGTVAGLSASESVVLQNNGGDNLTVNSNLPFTFSTPIAQGAPYKVTVLTQPATQTCTINSGSGTAGTADITNVQVLCAINAYKVGGTVSNLSGTVVLQNNDGHDLTINNDGAFNFATSVAEGADYNVTVITQPPAQKCTVTNGSGTMGGANVNSVGVNCVANTAILSTSVSQLALSVTGLTEYGITPSTSGLSRIITITNTGSNSASNLSVTFPTFPSGTTRATNCGGTLAPNSSCTITVTPGNIATSDGTHPCSSGTAPVPSAIQVSADNAATVSPNVVVLNYSCIYQSGYVYAFDDTVPITGSVGGKVVTTFDQAAVGNNIGIIWSSNGGTGHGSGGLDVTDVSLDLLPGIDETSTTLPGGSPLFETFYSFFINTYIADIYTSAPQCNGATDGFCNTGAILYFYNQFITNNTSAIGGSPKFTPSAGPTNITYYAAGLCTQTIASYTDWYLPAICEMGYGIQLDNVCGFQGTPTLQNIQSSLIDTGGLSSPAGLYWSSTENSISPLYVAWNQFFASGGNSDQFANFKQTQLGVRCSRALTI